MSMPVNTPVSTPISTPISAPMSILFVAEQLKMGGAERHLLALATGLARRGHEIVVAYLKEDEQLAAQFTRGGVRRVACCHSRGGLDLAAVAKLAALSREVAPQVVVATSHYALMFASLAGLRSPASLAFICHSMEMVQRTRRDRLRFLVYRHFYRCASRVIFVSQVQRAFFAGLGVCPRHVEIVYNGIDLNHFSFAPVATLGAELRRRHGFGAHEMVVGLCAIYREEKRQVDLLAALAQLRARGLAIKVALVGDGPMRARILACIDALGLRDAVVLCGFQQDVRPFIAMCDVMALTSDTETFPIATLEYMALAKPLVASDVGGMREQIEHGKNGLLYRAGDVAALAEALAQLGDPALRLRLGQGALASVRRHFGLQHMLERYESIFGHMNQQGSQMPCRSKT